MVLASLFFGIGCCWDMSIELWYSAIPAYSTFKGCINVGTKEEKGRE